MLTLVTAPFDESGLAALRQHGEVRYEPWTRSRRILGGADLVSALEGVDVFITEADNLRRPEIEALDKLQIICSCRGNPVNIDIPAATERGVPVVDAPGRNAQAVADLTVALIIMLARNILPAAKLLAEREPGKDRETLGRIYMDLRGWELWNRTVGLVGLGAVGQQVARRLRPFECRLLGSDPFVPAEAMAQLGVQKVTLDTLLAESDFVSLHVMVNDATRGMIGEREFGLMKPSAYFINTARSALTNEGVLVEFLRDGRIAGAGLDVFDKEPLPVDHPLFKLANVVLLPHIGGATHQVILHHTEIVVPAIEALMNGKRPRNVVNPSVLDSFTFRQR